MLYKNGDVLWKIPNRATHRGGRLRVGAGR